MGRSSNASRIRVDIILFCMMPNMSSSAQHMFPHCICHDIPTHDYGKRPPPLPLPHGESPQKRSITKQIAHHHTCHMFDTKLELLHLSAWCCRTFFNRTHTCSRQHVGDTVQCNVWLACPKDSLRGQRAANRSRICRTLLKGFHGEVPSPSSYLSDETQASVWVLELHPTSPPHVPGYLAL